MRRLASLAGLLAAVAALLLGSAGAAAAHATLESTTPGSGTVVASAPAEVTATFDEAVGVSEDSLRVLDPSGRRVDVGSTTVDDAPDRIRVSLRSGLGPGTYTVAWHVVSADSHPVSGAFTFSIGHPSTHVAVSAAGGSRTVSVAYAVARGLGYLGYAVLAGGLVFLTRCWPAGLGVRRARRLLLAGGAVAVVATAAGWLLQGVYAAALGPAHLLDGAVLDATVHSRVGAAALVRLGLLLVLVAGSITGSLTGGLPVWRRPVAGPVTALAATTAIAVTWPVADHASVGRLVPLTVALTVVHVVAMAVWLGGLAMLLVSAPAPEHFDDARAAADRFSALAAACVVLLVATGVYRAWRETGRWAALVHTAYGAELLAKTAAVTVLIGLGGLSRRHLRRRGTRLRRRVLAEAVVALVVLGLTATLVETATARESYHPVVQASRAFDTGSRRGTVAVVVTPARAGPQTVALDVRSDGRGYDPAELTATLTLTARHLGPLVVRLHPTAAGRYASDPVPLDVRGTWTLTVTVRSSAFDETTVEVPVPIT